MSKYTEAIARKIDEENYYHDCMISYLDNESVSEHYRDMMEKASLELEALQIADRLEQAITDEQTADCIIVDVECVNNKHNKEVWLNGYNQALVDIRGDNNG